MKKFILLAIISSVIGALVLSLLFFNSEEVKEEIVLSTKINSKKVILESNPFVNAVEIDVAQGMDKAFAVDGEIWIQKKIRESEPFFTEKGYDVLWVESSAGGFSFWGKRDTEKVIYTSQIFHDGTGSSFGFFINRKIGNAWLENGEVKTKVQSQRNFLTLLTGATAWIAISFFACMMLWIVSDMRKAKKARESAPADDE
jgi:hypothetical protein